MSQVSCRATRMILEIAEERGLDTSQFVVGLPVDLEVLRDVRKRIPWNVYVDFLDNAERVIGDLAELEKFGAAMVKAPAYRFFQTAARYVVTTRQLHELGSRYVAPVLFPDLPFEVRELTDHRLVLHCELPPMWRTSPAFFAISRGCLASISTLLGLPPSIVNGSISGRSMTLELLLPRDERRGRSLVRRLRDWIAGVPIKELIDQQDAVNVSYEMLLRSRQEFRDLLEGAPMGAAIYRDGRYVWANGALAQMLGWDRPADLVGRALADDVHPLDREAAGDRIRDPSGKAQIGRVRVLRRDGSTAIYDVAASQEVVFDGKSARLIVGNDVTERVRVRQQLAVADRMAAVGMLAAGVAHEINNPLTYVQLNMQAIARALERSDASPDLQSAATTALEGMARVRAIVADLRTFARVDEDTVAPTDVNEVVSSTLRLAQKTIDTSATIEVALGDVAAVRANRGGLGHVVLNVLLNAHEAVEERGGPGIIRVRTFAAEEGRVQIEIADSGVGIAPDAIRRVFEPFYTTKAVGRGTGLGLAICHRIVTAAGGEISIESAPSAPELRTFVRVTLMAAEGQLARNSTPTPIVTARRRVLVVDDEPAVGEAIVRALGELHEVRCVSSGAAAIEVLRESPDFDVVLCDVMMPGLDGIAVFEEVQRTAPELARRFVFMSGGAFTARARSFLATCRNPRFEKPFSADQLNAIVAAGR
ncbi:MAG: hybrid sensor histidine kinase/response regulator [Polyangiales bacterium]